MSVITWVVIGVIASVWMTWRFASRRHTLPCPVWLRWLVELENPFTKTTRANEIIVHLDIKPGMHVADIGCGPGRVTIPLANAVGPTGQVLAIDSQEGMLKRAQQRAREAHLSNIQFLRANAETGISSTGQFDRVILVTVLGEIPNRVAALKSANAMMKPDGILSISEIIFDPHYQSRNTVTELAKQAGFCEQAFFGNRLAYTLHFIKAEK